ncbi:hypothetical protein NGRA_2713 [Nosema granulosis]|uniref:Uncharacterized protein n=1 Tax=Nosema granulosis TaxID=83296 RepID=A0A9P6GZB8_9MICR|nr:hypothetical protein NGRA_2713 [Nosema granulosis]
MVVHRSHSDIKSLLYQTASTATSWEHFVQIAEEVAGIAYPNEMLSRVENVCSHQQTNVGNGDSIRRQELPRRNFNYRQRMAMRTWNGNGGQYSTKDRERERECQELCNTRNRYT